MRSLLLLCVLTSSACLRSTEYRCEGDSSCGGTGVCETTGFCSFIDGECASGRRYNDSAGSLGGTCTSGGTTQDDANTTTDDTMEVVTDGSMGDTPVAQCPAGYVTLTGGNAGHMYKVITGAATWGTQEAACQLTTAKSHLAIPDDLTELTAIDTAAGTARYWVGVSDQATENTWLNTLGAAQTFLPWENGAPNDGNPGEDCVESNPVAHEFNDERCNTSRPAVCECAP